MKWEYRLPDLPVPNSRDEMEQVSATSNGFGALGWEVLSASFEGDQAILVYLSGQSSPVPALFRQSFAKIFVT